MVKNRISKVIAIDFDGTITDRNLFPRIGKPRKDAIKYINKLHTEGHYIIIWTCRGEQSLIAMADWLDKNGVKYNKINENAPLERIGFKPSPKVFANYYIDDLGFQKLPCWSEIYRILKERIIEDDEKVTNKNNR